MCLRPCRILAASLSLSVPIRNPWPSLELNELTFTIRGLAGAPWTLPPAANEHGLLFAFATIPAGGYRGRTLDDAAHVRLISFGVGSLELTGMFN